MSGKIFNTTLAVFCFLLVGGASPCAHAKTEAELKQVEQKLQISKEKEGALRAEEQKTAANVAVLQQKLVTASDALQDKQKEAEKLSEKLESLSEANKTKAEKLKTSRAHLTSLMTSLVELSREPPEALLLHTTLTTDQIHRGILLRELLPRVQETAASVAADLAEMDRMKEALAEQRKLVAASEQNLGWQKKNLDQMVRIRQGSLKKTAAERAAMAKQLATLSAEAQDLRQLMQKVSQSMALPKSVEKETRNLKLNKGLRMPVAGRLVRPFGVRDASGVISQGLTLVGSAGGPIVAPSAGRVVFAGPFRGYGMIVILAHRGGYHSFLAGFGRIDAEMGQDIAGGEPLGILPDSTARPELYFEWRFRNEPIDPAS